MPSRTATIVPASSAWPSAPAPSATIDSPKAMMTISPWRSAMWPASTFQPSTPKRKSPPTSITIARIQQAVRTGPSTMPGDQQQQRGRQHRARQAADHEGQLRVVAAEDHVGADVQHPHDRVGDAEGQRVMAERVRHGDRHDEHPARGGEERDAKQPFVGPRRVAQPGKRRPRPPDHDEDRHALEQAHPVRVGGDEAGDLRDREDEDEVEEELQRGDALLGLGRRRRALGDGQRVGHAVTCSGRSE